MARRKPGSASWRSRRRTLERHSDSDARRRRCGGDAAVAARVGVGTESLHSHVRAAGVSPTQSSVTSSTSCQTRPSDYRTCAACMSQATPRRQARGHADAFPLVATRSTLVGTPPFKELAEGLIEDYYVAAVQPSDPLRSRQQTTSSPGPECARTRRTPCSRCVTGSDFSCATCPGTQWHTCLGRGGDASRWSCGRNAVRPVPRPPASPPS